ncbi:GNAT family protein [Limnohabitans sp.]|uniref:GNAT family N-acetyltransferase n=1 Tax=Limnohabitans sp. TaxID=1907725 RepID=UPI00286F9FF1|nr:GNAT family protein [Limnohabitans sp.]
MTVNDDLSLRGSFVALEPLVNSHTNALKNAVTDGELWRLWYASVPSPDEMSNYVDTAINTEAKYLLMQYWFEVQQANAVEFRTHFFNEASRRAIERLGAKQDGILRSHQILKDGSIRDTVVYSIIVSEWPAVKNNLQAKFAKFRSAANPDA